MDKAAYRNGEITMIIKNPNDVFEKETVFSFIDYGDLRLFHEWKKEHSSNEIVKMEVIPQADRRKANFSPSYNEATNLVIIEAKKWS